MGIEGYIRQTVQILSAGFCFKDKIVHKILILSNFLY